MSEKISGRDIMLKQSVLVPVFLLAVAATPIALAASRASTPLTPGAANAPAQVKVWTWLLKMENLNYPRRTHRGHVRYV